MDIKNLYLRHVFGNNACVLYHVYLFVCLLVSQSNSQPESSNDLIKRCPPNLFRTYTKAAEWERCYEFHTEERTWIQANSVCQRNGGHLVTIREERIQNFLYRALVEYRWPRNGLWIGATDREREMDWRWITGERVRDGYQKWARGQPSCGLICMEDCAVMKWKESGKWHDYHCSLFEEYSFICEYAMMPKPTTTTTTTLETTTLETTTLETTTPETTTLETTTLISSSEASTTTEIDIHVTNDTSTSLLTNMGLYRVQEEEPESDASSGLGTGLLSAQSGQLQENKVADNKGLLVALIISVISGILICIVVIFFIRRRRKRNLKEADDGLIFANPFYGEAKQPLTAETPEADVAYDKKADEITNFVVNGHTDADTLVTPQKRVMNVYDKPPTRSVPLQKANQPLRNPEVAAAASAAENYYEEVRSNPRKINANYDVPRQLKDTDDAACMENDYYNNQEENIYESLENLQVKVD